MERLIFVSIVDARGMTTVPFDAVRFTFTILFFFMQIIGVQIDSPYLWHPSIVETQMLRIGQVFIVAVPGELSTMAGRRLRESINQVASSTAGGPSNAKTIIAGLSNVYTHYITTFEGILTTV